MLTGTQEADTGASFTGVGSGSQLAPRWSALEGGGGVSHWVGVYTPFIQIMFPSPLKLP